MVTGKFFKNFIREKRKGIKGLCLGKKGLFWVGLSQGGHGTESLWEPEALQAHPHPSNGCRWSTALPAEEKYPSPRPSSRTGRNRKAWPKPHEPKLNLPDINESNHKCRWWPQ